MNPPRFATIIGPDGRAQVKPLAPGVTMGEVYAAIREAHEAARADWKADPGKVFPFTPPEAKPAAAEG